MITRTAFVFFLALFSVYGYGQDTRPNILLIVADDLGYSSITPYGSEIKTPFLDEIANQSILFTNFHTLPTCSPSRSVLLTGTDNHIAGLGAQQGGITDRQKGQPGYEGYLNFKVATLPELLLNSGYRTYMSGKWHLGHEDEHVPSKRGFQETFVLTSGGGSHFSDQKPLHPDDPVFYRRNGKPITELPDDFYSSKNYTDSLLYWLDRDQDVDQPFFAYLAYTAPHDPLQAPEAFIKKYRGVFDEGYEVMREKKFQKLKALGIIDSVQVLPAWPSTIPRWHRLSKKRQQEIVRDMETYAAMVDYMDQQIGRIYQWLEAKQVLDQTLIIFLGDNGVSGLNPKKIYPSYNAEFASQFNNQLSNRGLTNSFTALDAGWAVATNVIYRDFKYSTAEGGIRTPCLIKPVTGIPPTKQWCKSFTHISDLMPTILDITATQYPNGSMTSSSRIRGQSLWPLLQNPSSSVHQHTGHGIELHGARAFIKEGWKILQTPIPGGSGDWELYNLDQDPAEQNNLIFSHWDKFKELCADYQNYAKEVGIIHDFPAVVGTINTGFNILFWSLIVILSLSMIQNWKAISNGWVSPSQSVLYVLLVIEMIGVIGLFTIFNLYAASLLIATKIIYFLILVKSKANWKAHWSGVSAFVLLGSFLLLKSGWLVILLL